MESTNFHHQQPNSSLQQPSSLSFPLAGTTHSWTPNISLNAENNLNNPGSRASTQENNIDIGVPPRSLNGSMIQDLGYHHHHQWTTDASEISFHSFPKFSEMLNSSMEGYGLIQQKDMNALNEEKFLFKTLFSSGEDLYSNNSAQNYPNNFVTTTTTSRGNFINSQIYPSIHISNLNQSSTNSTAISSSLDLFSSPAGLNQHSQNHALGRFADNLSFSIQHVQHPNDRSSCSNYSNVSQLANGTAETKRGCTLTESKTSQSQTALKKSRLDSRPSCPPLKVRKEKLGDRIAALQQLVAPFGKTDTASVLMEAIGYIKFLQGQVETLSVPYMKSSSSSSQNQNHQSNRIIMQRGGSVVGDGNGEGKQQDLRSRGLCLVPLSCMSYITGDSGTEVWQQPNFRGTT